ncbi:hypothetical protein PVK06_027462 [Gossypium arboreum]|uniref:Reverse transcriptase Ty1/copia-type domain-containing protein n=1 Tax=Gossypium arboreum TaxID=29729 RepID=A0ABR0P3A3_GOSAR|nr:hypothetical protein PVK06_027462 [Gossypium arboreum]
MAFAKLLVLGFKLLSSILLINLVFENPKNHLLLMAYVDDIVLTGSCGKDIEAVVHQLHTKFALKDLGDLNFFLRD